ncbi:hypothetical protein [Streptomyces sp. Caat 7-52]|uniref:hypothetical protein n=1 Tax=Streptomyces sp. Caat 7-52 TaxID=2949637 RepID=UPI0020355EEC|nr:hypothetical protein [Streptomyces sp. Caat 7-52]
MHFKTTLYSVARDLVHSRDCDSASGQDIEGTGYKDVWFEVCNENLSGDRPSCARLHK